MKEESREVMSLHEIAKELGITRQSVGAILKNALRKVEIKLKERGLRKEDLL
jgi:DNA-directed RNA polymerase sigma subunit (sigma70/sigma32)